jgi:hypothetical protein
MPKIFSNPAVGEIGYEEIPVLGLLEVTEHVPVSYSTSFNATVFRYASPNISNKLYRILEIDDIVEEKNNTVPFDEIKNIKAKFEL